jgi:hypothetical protein
MKQSKEELEDLIKQYARRGRGDNGVDRAWQWAQEEELLKVNLERELRRWEMLDGGAEGMVSYALSFDRLHMLLHNSYYTPLIHALLSCTPLLHSSPTLLSYMHSSHTSPLIHRLSYIASHTSPLTRLSYTR